MFQSSFISITFFDADLKTNFLSSDDNQQLERLVKRDNFKEEEARSRINAQMSMEEKRKRADYIIHNNGTINNTKNQVQNICHQLKSFKTHWIIRIGIVTIFAVLLSSSYFAGALIYKNLYPS